VKNTFRRHLTTALRLLLIAAGVAYIVWIVDWSDQWVTPEGGGEPELRRGMVSLLKTADLRWLLGGLALIGVVFPVQAMRWWWLMRCRGLRIAPLSVMRLVMVGLFFNFCVPVGSNGGDVVKAYGAARGTTTPGSTAITLVSVLLDRIAGLIGLILLAAVVGTVMWSDPVGQKIAVIAWSALAVVLFGGGAYLWPRSRRWLGIEWMTRFSLVQKLDAAVTGYRHHPAVLTGVVGLSLPIHVATSVATAMAGYAIGLPTPLLTLVAALPIVFIAGALPLTFLGLGVMELTAAQLLITDTSMVSTNQIAAMLMAYRVYLLVYAALGGLLMLGKGMHLREHAP